MTSTTLQLSDHYGTLSCREAGSGAPLVLLHGVGMQSEAWGPQIAALSATHRVIALDMPGHGGSSPLPENAQLADFIDWLDASITALELEHVCLAGHSMGALIAAGYAATHPEKLTRVALLNGVFRRTNEARNAVIARADVIRSGGFDLETPLTRWFGDSPIEQTARRQVSGWLSEVDLGGYATAYGAFARGDDTYADRISDIPCPFLAITGDGDLNSTPAMSRAMAEAAPLGRAMVIKGHRHMVNLTAPDAVNAALADWLTTEGETS
ncbi:alpha/beta hydrolase [Aliiroseovarius sp. KMU-50]|uniref:Alpha/beta hydrolase n=1 Tax=Aliiroseovarius salicola TaxID=3009082 RepID=A0ABT4VZX9_9RHOB|nr:alpha/beta hydrolase [Aliiroseovarius sp. KMU-50]MDA5093771.1 alpha/beta hydrolase [Aliiroseovarius sp. KMU-50]